jgi:hypothetical protein
MSSFSSRHAPPYPAAGPEIPVGVRDALLGWFNDPYGVSPTEIWTKVRQAEGFSTSAGSAADDILDRFGEEAAQKFIDRVRYGGQEPLAWSYASDKEAVAALLGLPTPLFLDALEHAVHLLGRVQSGEWEVGGFVPLGIDQINRVFEKRGIHYRMTANGKAEWHGDETAYRDIVAPALAALNDSRLAGSKVEFETALADLRRRTEQNRREAVAHAGAAVESAMKMLLDAHNLPRPKNQSARNLWEELWKTRIVAEKSEFAILAAPHLATTHGRHGVGTPAPVPAGVPEMAVQSGASAISYLAQLLP